MKGNKMLTKVKEQSCFLSSLPGAWFRAPAHVATLVFISHKLVHSMEENTAAPQLFWNASPQTCWAVICCGRSASELSSVPGPTSAPLTVAKSANVNKNLSRVDIRNVWSLSNARRMFFFLCLLQLFNHMKWWVCVEWQTRAALSHALWHPLRTWMLPHFSSGRFIVAGMLETGHYHELLEVIIQAKRRTHQPGCFPDSMLLASYDHVVTVRKTFEN